MNHERKRVALVVGALSALILGGALLSHRHHHDGQDRFSDDEARGLDGERPFHRSRNPRWQTRKLLQTFVPQNRSGTFIWTPVYEAPRPFYVQVQFASAEQQAGSPATPALPFQPFSSARVKITLQRYNDDFGGVLEDSYIVNGYNPSEVEPAWLPVAIVATRKLVILAECIDEAPGHTAQFVDVTASLVETIDTRAIIQDRYSGSATFLPNIFGFGEVPIVANVAASAAPVQLLPADQTRRQFWITNEGDTRMAIRFSANNPDVSPGTEAWDVILDPKGGAVTRYESPVDSYWGPINAVWEGAPTGFAMVSGASIL